MFSWAICYDVEKTFPKSATLERNHTLKSVLCYYLIHNNASLKIEEYIWKKTRILAADLS